MENGAYILAGVIILLVTIATIYIIDHKKLKEERANNLKAPEDHNSISFSGVKINLTKDEIAAIDRQIFLEDLELFNSEKRQLIKQMEYDLETTRDIIKRKVLAELLNKRMLSQQELDEVKFLYNNGKLRSEEEIRKHKIFMMHEKDRENYDNERHKINTLAFFLPFLIVGGITFFLCNDIIFGIPLGLLFGLSAGFIGMLFGYDINIENAKTYGIPDNDPRVQDEKLKKKIGIASGVAAGVSMYHNTKKAVKDIGNVDSWSQMK